jgi:hypothetical protein
MRKSGGVPCLFLVSTVHAAILTNPQGWRFPNIVTADKEVIRLADETPLIPGKETILKGYRKADGTYFMTFEIEGRVFGAQVDTDGKPPFEYGIMDGDGDGTFETKIVPEKGSKDRGYVPQWIIDYYYSKHPEAKKPAGVAKAEPPTLTSAPRPDKSPAAAHDAAAIPSPEILSQPSP